MIFADRNINIKNLFQAIKLIILANAVIFLYACSEDTIVYTNNNEVPVVDSNLFSWRYVPVQGYNFYDSYIADTNAVFYVLDEKVFYYNGNTSIQIDNGVAGESLCIDGVGTSLLYIGGRNTENNYYKPFLKKWNGSVFEEIELPLDSNNQVLDICVETSNNVWFAGISGRIYHYDGISVSSYHINLPNTYPKLFFKDNQVFFYTESPSTYGLRYVYKFNNNDWELIVADTGSIGMNFTSMRVFSFSNFVLRKTPRYLEEFNSSSWTPYLQTPTFEAYSVSGNNLSDFVCIGIPDGTLEFFPYYYDGEKWFKQDRAIPENIFYGFPVELKYCKGTYYGFYYAIEIINHNYIMVGKMNTPPGK